MKTKIVVLCLMSLLNFGCAVGYVAELAIADMESPKGKHYDFETGSYQTDEPRDYGYEKERERAYNEEEIEKAKKESHVNPSK